MKGPGAFVIGLMAAVLLAFPWPAAAQERPDIYVSVFGGGNVPFRTDVRETGPATNLTASNVELKKSGTVGGKMGLYLTEFRDTLDMDVGMELDITNFSPDAGRAAGAMVTPMNISSNIVAVNFLLRKPFEVTYELPNGRWYPYIGIGGGLQTSTFEPPGITRKGSDTSAAFQWLAGAKVFLTQHVALFGEYKFTHASHTFGTQNTTTGAITTDKYTFDVNHFTAGIAVHF